MGKFKQIIIFSNGCLNFSFNNFTNKTNEQVKFYKKDYLTSFKKQKKAKTLTKVKLPSKNKYQL